MLNRSDDDDDDNANSINILCRVPHDFHVPGPELAFIIITSCTPYRNFLEQVLMLSSIIGDGTEAQIYYITCTQIISDY